MWVCRLPVHIGPAECTVFTGIYGEFVISQWADRVVRLYSVRLWHALFPKRTDRVMAFCAAEAQPAFTQRGDVGARDGYIRRDFGQHQIEDRHSRRPAPPGGAFLLQ